MSHTAAAAGPNVERLVCDRDDWPTDHPRFQVHRNPPDAPWNERLERWLAYVPSVKERAGASKQFVWILGS